jgi:calcium-binding protein CML
MARIAVIACTVALSIASARGADALTGAVGPYDPIAERNRFLDAVGRDNELSEDEFNAQKGKDGAFVRSYDRWKSMLRYDADRNGTIDWLEADRYRSDLHKRILKACDADGDGRLTGQERSSAIKALAKGSDDPPKVEADPPRLGEWPDERVLIERFDKDGDGKLSAEERRVAINSLRFERAQAILAAYDENDNGKLDEEEVGALKKGMRERKRRRRDEWRIRLFDDDRDGQLSEREQQNAEKAQEAIEALGKRMKRDMMDADGDGEITQAETAQAMQRLGPVMKRLGDRMQRLADTDGDGEVSTLERAVAEAHRTDLTHAYLVKIARRADTDGDGRFSAGEREGILAEFQKEYARRLVEHDVDRDARLSPQEAERLVVDLMEDMGVLPPASAPGE